MRAIDADALKYAIVEEGQRSKRYKLGEFWELNGDEIWRVIDAQPTIAWEREKANKEKGDNVVEEAPSTEAKAKCIAQIKVDTEELVRRIKEEYDIADGWIPVSDRLPEDDKRFFNALKPNKEIDRSWGIGMKVPVCPNCEAIISPMCFWKNCGDKVGWCEYCGQKIDWSGWEKE